MGTPPLPSSNVWVNGRADSLKGPFSLNDFIKRTEKLKAFQCTTALWVGGHLSCPVLSAVPRVSVPKSEHRKSGTEQQFWAMNPPDYLMWVAANESQGKSSMLCWLGSSSLLIGRRNQKAKRILDRKGITSRCQSPSPRSPAPHLIAQPLTL